MKILILNWRDIRSPKGGGAERVTHEVARRLAGEGHEVTWLSSVADGLPSEEVIDGVRIVRRGSEVTTRLHAPRVARQVACDVVIEEINTLPYFAPLWSKAPVLLYMNQLARDVWWHEAPAAVAAVGWLAEPLYLRAYRGCDAVTISASSRDDLRRVGIRGTISIAPMAADIARAGTIGVRARTGALVSIGRLTPSKRYDHAIEALALLRERFPAATLTLIGSGRSLDDLHRIAAKAGVADAVRFAGRLSEAEKVEVIDHSDILVGTSVREGWGLTVTEAAARGTPSVVYDVPGFRDSVISGRTGLLVEPTPTALASGVERLLLDEPSYDRMRESAWLNADRSTFDAAAATFRRALMDLVGDSI
jgi:glycosyltransferase involved in cell wall biosynthesis